MEYLFLGLFVWAFLSLPALIYAAVIEARRRRDADKFNRTLAELTHEMEILERRTRVAPAPASADSPDVIHHVSTETLQEPSSELQKPAPNAVPQRPETAVQKPATPPPAPEKKEISFPPAVIPEAVHRDLPQSPAAIPSRPPVQPPALTAERDALKEVAAQGSTLANSETNVPTETNAAARVQVPAPPVIRNLAPLEFKQIERPRPDRTALKKRSLSLEEALGTNWFPKLGITAVVIGVGLLVGASWGAFAPWLRVIILYLAACALLSGGIFLERKEQHRVLGRSLIGGGWAVTFLVTYAISHAQSLLVLKSQPLDLLLMLAVTAAMVWHTLKYDSQLVTGIAFLLGFTAVALNADPPYNLIAGAMLVTGLTVIVLQRQWFELEVFGILASYLNHLLWLYPIVEPMGSHKHEFPQFASSVVLLGFYWIVFRASYLLRKPSSLEKESVSTIAGLLNAALLLGVMKYQSFRPEMAFYALLTLGAVEFTLGQLPASRRRMAPFRILSSLGALLMVAAVPFKYSGNSLELLWLAAAESFLFAGIFTRERLFRAFGLIASFLVALYAVMFRMGSLAGEVFNSQPHYHRDLGIVFAGIAIVLYANAHVTRRLWPELFRDELDKQALAGLSFVASLFTLSASFALVGDAAVALVLTGMVTVLNWTGFRFKIAELNYESHWMLAVAIAQLVLVGQKQHELWHGIPCRLIIFIPMAALVYVSSRFVRLSGTCGSGAICAIYKWAGTFLLAYLAYDEIPQPWTAVAWVSLAALLSIAARFWNDRALLWQTHLLSALAAGWTFYANFAAQYRGSLVQLIAVGLTAFLLYLLNWNTNIAGVVEDERIPQGYSWAASLLLSWLAWYQLDPVNVSLAWGVFGLALLEISDLARLGRSLAGANLRAQCYVALVCSFAHLFYSNFDTRVTGTWSQVISDPRVLTVLPLIVILFWVDGRLQGLKRLPGAASYATSGTISARVQTFVGYLIACLGTATLASLIRFESNPEAVVIGFAAIVVGLHLVAWFTGREIFVFQALIMLGVAAFRIATHNFFYLHESFSSSLQSSIWAIALLAAGVPLSFLVRKREQSRITGPGWAMFLLGHPEQPMFFVPVVLLAVLLALKMPGGMITLAWGIQGMLVFVVALLAKERSYRLTGVALLIVCMGKIVFWDVWQIGDPRARYLTLIGVGALLLLVSFLYGRNREALREYL